MSAKKRKINRTFTIDSSKTKIHSIFLNFNKKKKNYCHPFPPEKTKKKHANSRFSKRKKKKKRKAKEKGEVEKEEQYENEHVSAVCGVEAPNWTNRNFLFFNSTGFLFLILLTELKQTNK